VTGSYYDVVVMGMEIGPLAAGALLARRGFRVLVVGGGAPFERYSCYGYRFSRRPFLLTAAHSPAVRRVFEELGLVQMLQQAARQPSPSYQIVTPSARVDVSPELHETVDELRRELGIPADEIERVLRGLGRLMGELDKLLGGDLVLPAESFFERRELSRADVQNPFRANATADVFGALGADLALAEILAVPALFESAGRPASAFQTARQTGGWLFGAMAIDDGRDGVRRLLADRIIAQGGDVHTGLRASQIVVSRGRVKAVRIAGREEPYPCQAVLTDLAPRELAPMISPGEWPKRFRVLAEEAHEPALGYAVNLGLDAEAVPTGLAQTAFVATGRGTGDALLRLEVIPQDDPSRAAIHAACVVPPGGEESIRSGALRDAILDRLRWLVPFLDNHLRAVHSPFDGFGPMDLTRSSTLPAPPVPRSEEVPRWLLHPPPPDGDLGVEGLPHRTGIKGLVLAGAQVVCGLGAEGELIAAWGAARLAGKVDPRRERLVRAMLTKVED
jgi:phytoene dehydrogenase-like protein